VFEIASMEMGRTEWALLVRFRGRTHASTALLPVALGPNLVTEAVERGLCAEAGCPKRPAIATHPGVSAFEANAFDGVVLTHQGR